MADLNPWKQIREYRIFSLTRANPIGVRVLVVPVLDDPVNAPVVTRLCGEFSNSMRSFANEVWLVTDLPDNPIKTGFYTALPQILADYRLKNHLSMELLKQMIPDFECDFVALFEVTDYDRFWVDEDLQHRVGVRAVLYDYETGDPKLEKFYQGGRGRRFEEGAFSEAERIAIKGLVEELETPLRRAVKERQKELERRTKEVGILAGRVGQRELAIHQYDLNLMQGQIRQSQEAARAAEREALKQSREAERWQKEAEKNRALLEKQKGASSSPGSNSPPPLMPSGPCPPMTDAGPPAQPQYSSQLPRVTTTAVEVTSVDTDPWSTHPAEPATPLDQPPQGAWEFAGTPR
jgi:hypothetical protein